MKTIQIDWQKNIATFIKTTLYQLKNKYMYVIGIWLTILMSYIYFDGEIATAPKWLLGFIGVVCTILVLLKGKIHNIVGAMIILSGMLFVFYTPIMDVPDETAHYGRALYISDGHMYLPEKLDQAQVAQDVTVVENYFHKPLNKSNLGDIPMSNETVKYTKIMSTNASSFIPYIPQETGITLSRLFHQSVGFSIVLGRFLNLLCYALLVRLAIKKAGKLNILFAVIGLLPMSIYLASSFSTDAMANGLVFLVIALFLQLSQKSTIQTKDLLLLSVLCMVLITIKLPYVLLIGLLLFIPSENFDSKRLYGVIAGFILLAAIISLLWLKQSSNINSAVITSESSPVEKIRYTLEHLPKFTRLFFKEVLNLIPGKIPSLFTFGWLTYGAGNILWYYLMFISCVIFMFPYGTTIPKITRIGASLVGFGISSAILMTAYLMWNGIQDMNFNGVQGRYFIGVILLCGLSLNCSSFLVGKQPNMTDNSLQKRTDFVLFIALVFIVIATTLTVVEYYSMRV